MEDQKEASFLKALAQFERRFSRVHLGRDRVRVVGFGGDHSISYPLVKKALEDYEDLVVLHLDAHADLRDGYEGHHYSHASIIFRLLECFGPSHELIQYGIRSGTREEYSLMRSRKTLSFTREEFFQRVAAIDQKTPIYLTLDF